MVKKNENRVDRLLLITVPILLTTIASIVFFGGRVIINNQQETVKTQKETIEAVNNLRIVLSVHSEKIRSGEMKDVEQDTKIENLDTRVDVLEKK